MRVVNTTPSQCTNVLQHIPGTSTGIKATLFNIENILKDLFNPKACRKGMASILPGTPYPYRVIRPSPGGSFSFPYLCGTTTDGGGWIFIQRRMTGNVDFYRDWASYKKGFGSLDDEFWLGNENIHITTTKRYRYELRIDLKYNGRSAYAHYDAFWLENERSNYILRLGRYDGTAGDSMGQHRKKVFATDRDVYGKNCPELYIGAWWYSACHSANLNGKWMAYNYKGPRWRLFSGKNPVSFSEMKMRKL
ncbi:tenascin-r [Plakobranchus ocellatus]|uniref:Tenascin-r n=1 Tax=Plakobranchus ocellatus TaxID=259542 RepID=A0AAV4A8K2_9GAST|nr:tenascin-r [Plakobranchus ocellatus]